MSEKDSWGHKKYTRGGKNTFFLCPSLYVYKSESYSVMSNSLQPHGLYSPWNTLSQNTGVGSLFLLQGIFPTQWLNSGFWNCRLILYQLSHKGSPRILEWLAIFLQWIFLTQESTRVSCIACGFFINWAIREDSLSLYIYITYKIYIPYL